MTPRTPTDFPAVVAAIVAELPGWTLSPGTVAAFRKDPRRTWAEAIHADHPGALLSFVREDGARLRITADYPRGWQPYIHGRGGPVYRELITVSATKDPAVIARDITRRLFEATGYLARAAECWAQKTASEAGQAAAEALAEKLARLSGGLTEAARLKAARPDLDTEENRRRWTVLSREYATRLEGKVTGSGAAVELTLYLTPADAEAILAAWAARTKKGQP